VYYLKFTARKREAHLSRLALQKGHTNFMGLLGSFGTCVTGFLFAIGKHLIPHPVWASLFGLYPSRPVPSPRLRTTLAMPCAAAPRFPRCGRHFPVTFRASGLFGIAFFGVGCCMAQPKETTIERIYREVTGRRMPPSVKRILLRKPRKRH